jgi:hypothetical protein
MLWIFTSIFLRVKGEARYGAAYVFIANFGFYKGGLLNVSLCNLPGNQSYAVDLRVFTLPQYFSWLESHADDITDHVCSDPDAIDNWTLTLTSELVTRLFIIPDKDVYYVIIQSCVPEFPGHYYVDATFLNPNGQHLDYRDIPSLSVLPVAIPAFSLLFLFWCVYIFIKRSKFLAIHICLGVIVIFYILYLVFSEVTLKRAQETDEATASSIWLKVFQAFYDFTLFSTLIIATSGWCLLNVDVALRDLGISLAGVAVFVTLIFVQVEIDMGLWALAIFFGQLFAICLLMAQIWRSTSAAEKVIKAHLLVIQNDGILPSSTPIYQKLIHYQILLYVVGLSFLLVMLTNVNLSFFGAPNWLGRLVDNLIQFGILATVMYLYRPRGETIDRYMRRDDGQGEREEVLLDDLEGLAPTERRNGMREWEDGMDLPLEPLLVSSKERTSAFSATEEPDYTPVPGREKPDSPP